MKFNRNTPYNSLPLLPPKKEVETREVLKVCIRATRALAELKGLGKTIPNQSILIDSIVLQEAKTSSEIENIVTTNDILYKAASKEGLNNDQQTKEVLQYRKALKRGFKTIKTRGLTSNALKSIAEDLLARSRVIRVVPGTKLMNPNSNRIYYTPPEGEVLINKLLTNLEVFMHEESDLDVLVKMAIAHYQFEAIHPFYDGNGRTGRIMNILYLVEQGLLDIPVLYLSQYIINNKNTYYSLLRAVTEKEQWHEWILFMLHGIDVMAKLTSQRIVEIHNLFNKALLKARTKLPEKVYSKDLIEVIFTLPYSRIANLVDSGIAKRQTASVYLKALVESGLLQEVKEGRDLLYLNKPLLKLLKKPW